MIKKHTDFMASMERADSKLALKPDPQMQRGGCRLESEVQLLDGSVEAQFALFEEALLQYGPNN
jgi:flagellar biosynthesis/type III secretory pathway protein FliH